MMIRQKVISGLNIDFSSKWCLELLIKEIRCLTKVDNLDPNPINVGLLIHVCISLFMLENYSLFYACLHICCFMFMLPTQNYNIILLPCYLLIWMSFCFIQQGIASLPSPPNMLAMLSLISSKYELTLFVVACIASLLLILYYTLYLVM